MGGDGRVGERSGVGVPGRTERSSPEKVRRRSGAENFLLCTVEDSFFTAGAYSRYCRSKFAMLSSLASKCLNCFKSKHQGRSFYEQIHKEIK